MISVITTCLLYMKVYSPNQSVWQCKDTGYEVSNDPRLFQYPVGVELQFEVKIDENGNKVLVLKVRKK